MSGLTVTQQHIQSATNIRVSRNEMVPVFDALCTGTISVVLARLLLKKVDSVHTYWFVQMVVLFRVQVVLEVLVVLIAAWIRQVCSVCR